MTPAAWAAVIGTILLALVQAFGLVIWGARLTQRVNTLEEEVEPLKAMNIQVAKMEVKLDAMLEQFRDLNANLRWLRQPAEYDNISRQPANSRGQS